MKTYHIHIQGIVQGVGFRPFIYKLAKNNNISGCVSNNIDGVHIRFNTENLQKAEVFMSKVVSQAPIQAKITNFTLNENKKELFDNFFILESNDKGVPNMLLAPDYAICDVCRKELFDKNNNRNHYPFITCTNCGPRFAITNKLPYDRQTTTMDEFAMCDSCLKEYNDPLDRRYYSQTNSCPNCRIKLSWFENGTLLDTDFQNLEKIVDYWKKGKIVAIKGIGGYLLTCDATNPNVIKRLRLLKNRPSKPFALMYHDIYELAEDVELDIFDKLELESEVAPILLLQIKKDRMTNLAMDQIAPGLRQIGVMMPNTGLMSCLLKKYYTPIIATSGNSSNSTIIYNNKKAIENLSMISDVIILDNRDIIIPQDDSVINFTTLKYKKIILRRSRGLAPSYFNKNIDFSHQSILSMGAMMKSTFTIVNNQNVFISQYLGNTIDFEAENNYKTVLNHFEHLIKPQYDVILTDLHPNYFSSVFGKKLGKKYNIPVIAIQHHKAHFYAVLAENNLLNSQEKVLGVIWDGVGYGYDKNIWGGEFFEYSNGKMQRVHHFEYFDYFLGDKMSKEPRISALALMHNIDEAQTLLKEKFTKLEWNIYQKILKNKQLQTSSVGRIFDAISSLILGINKQSYEGEAAMLLENAAYKYFRSNGATTFYSYLKNGKIPENFYNFLVVNILRDLKKGFEKDFIAAKFHISMAHYIFITAKNLNFTKIAFSGGVFQNSWLIDLIILFMNRDFELFFHNELSPNDECISFGQVICFLNEK